jgi:hypothetical protein
MQLNLLYLFVQGFFFSPLTLDRELNAIESGAFLCTCVFTLTNPTFAIWSPVNIIIIAVNVLPKKKAEFHSFSYIKS